MFAANYTKIIDSIKITDTENSRVSFLIKLDTYKFNQNDRWYIRLLREIFKNTIITSIKISVLNDIDFF